MKKTIVSLILLAAMTLSLFGCAGKSAYEKEEWVFSGIVEVSIIPDLDELRREQLYEEFDTQDDAEIEAAFLNQIVEDGVFSPCYLNFSGNLVKYYDSVMEREATYAFYKTSENEGFLSVYTELNVEDGNPDPNTNPPFTYYPETNTFVVMESYIGFYVFVEYRAK